MATCTKPTRRNLVKLGAAGMLAPVAALATPAAAAPLHAEPTDQGRRVLGCLALYRDAWRSPPDELADRAGYAAFETGALGFIEEAEGIAREIAAAPVHTMSNVVDRAIVVGWLLNNNREDCWDGDLNALVGPLLALGGVRVELLDEDDPAALCTDATA